MVQRLAIRLQKSESNLTHDLTPYLSEAVDTVLTQERERQPFDFVVEDLSLKLDMIDGVVEGWFEEVKRGSRWYVTVETEGTLRFKGFVEPRSVKNDKKDEWMSLTVFSLNRMFWDKCRDAKVRPGTPALGLNYATRSRFADVLDRELIHRHFFSTGGPIIHGVSFPSTPYDLYERYIRDFGQIGDLEGRFMDIDPAMRYDTFLKECAKYYNCEFYVDSATMMLTARHREYQLAAAVEIDDRIRDDRPIEVQYVDGRALDYVETALGTIEKAPQLVSDDVIEYPSVTIRDRVSLPPGHYEYIATYWEGDSEVVASPTLEVGLGPVKTPSWGHSIGIRVFQGTSATFTKRALYRLTHNKEELGFRRIDDGSIVAGNAEVVIYDTVGPAMINSGLDELPNIDNFSTAYMRYTEAGGWDTPIREYEVAAKPPGQIMDVQPKIQFTSPAGADELLQYDPYSVWKFFDSEMNPELFHEHFKDMFLSRKVATFRLSGSNYGVGDLLHSLKLAKRVPYWVVKKARVNLSKEFTDVIAVPSLTGGA